MPARKTTGFNRRIVNNTAKFFLEFVEIVIMVLAISWFSQTYVFGVVTIKDHSMLPTLESNNRVLVSKVLRNRTLDRGDIIALYKETETNATEKATVKRVIGLAGDTVEIRNGYVYINNKPYYEPDLSTPVTLEFSPVVVPKNHVFVLNDNRLDDNDSRKWGSIPIEKVIGEVQLCYWPLFQIKFL